MSQVSASRDGLQDGCSPSLGHCWPRPANSGDPPPAWGRLRVLPSRPSSRSRSRFRRGLGQSSPEPAGQTNEPSEAPPSCPGRAPRAGNPDRAAAHLRFLCFPPGPAIALPRPPPQSTPRWEPPPPPFSLAPGRRERRPWKLELKGLNGKQYRELRRRDPAG